MKTEQQQLTIESIQEAIRKLYSHESSPRVRKSADQYLQKAQRNPLSLGIALEILRRPLTQVAHADHFFASKTVYETTLKKNHENVEPHVVCDQIFGALLQFVGEQINAHDVITTLATSIAVLYLHHFSSDQLSIIDFLNQCVHHQPPSPKVVFTTAVLHVLVVYPEEIVNRRISISVQRRNDSVAAFQHFTMQGLEALAAVQQDLATSVNQDEKLHLECLLLDAFANWLEHGSLPGPSFFLNCSLFQQALNAMRSEIHFNHALGVAAAVTNAVVDGGSEYGQVIQLFCNSLVENGLPIVQRVSLEDDDGIRNVQRSFVSTFSESMAMLLPRIMDTIEESERLAVLQKIVQVLLISSQNLPVDISSLTFCAWGSYFDAVSNHCNGHSEHKNALGAAAAILSCVLLRSEYPSDFAQFDLAYHDTFTDYREDVRNFLRDIVDKSCANEHFFMRELSVNLLMALSEAKKLAMASELPPSWWSKIEVCLHALSAIAKRIPDNENDFMPQLLSLLSELPVHRALSSTSTLFLSVMCNWFKHNTDGLHWGFQIISKSLYFQEIGPNASLFSMRSKQDHVGAVALYKLAMACGEKMFQVQYMDGLIKLYAENFNQENNLLEAGSHRVLLEAIVQILHVSPDLRALEYGQRLVEMLFMRLTDFLNAATNEEHIDKLLEHLAIVARISSKPNPENPADKPASAPMLHLVDCEWNTIQQMLYHCSSSEMSFEGFCNVFIELIQANRHYPMLFVQPLLASVLDIYQHQAWLSCINVVVCIFKNIPENTLETTAVASMLCQILEISLAKLQQVTPERGFDPKPYQSIFEMLWCCGNTRPAILAQEKVLSVSFQYARYSIGMKDESLAQATCKYYTQVADWYGSVEKLDEVLLTENPSRKAVHDQIGHLLIEFHQGVDIVEFLMFSIRSEYPFSMLGTFADALHHLWYSFDMDIFRTWLMLFFQRNPEFPRPTISTELKQTFLENLLAMQCRANKRKFRRVLQSFCGPKKK